MEKLPNDYMMQLLKCFLISDPSYLRTTSFQEHLVVPEILKINGNFDTLNDGYKIVVVYCVLVQV